MTQEVRKVVKIVDELLTFLLQTYGAEIAVEVKPLTGSYFVRIVARDCPMRDDELAQLRTLLSAPRQPELEEYYWQLAGESEDGNELRLVAMMCDTLNLKREGTSVVIELTRVVQGTEA